MSATPERSHTTTTNLDSAARKAIFEALKMRKGESFLLVTDKQKLDIAEALARYAKDAGAEVTTYLMTETVRPISAPTRMFEVMIKMADVTTYLLEGRIQEKPFRAFMARQGARGRVCLMPGITRDMFERLVNIEFGEMRALTNRVIEAMRDARSVRVTNPAGTDISFSMEGRPWTADVGAIAADHAHGNLPAGEAYSCPLESTFTGVVSVSSIDDKVGPGRWVFREGRVAEYDGDGIREVMDNIGSDETGKVIGEFGIGTNRGARICPNMLEAEKAFGTCHFAIGDSIGIGINRSLHHYDALVEKVTIVADGRTIIERGEFRI